MSKDFVHLHVHTEYSIQDAMSKVKNLVARAAELGQKAIAITDHGNVFGVVHMYKEAKKKGIKPIIGCEMYVCPEGKEAKIRNNRHIVLLAKNEIGYFNLMQIVTEASVDGGFYYNARTDYESLSKYSEGLICLTACLGGDVPKTIEVDGYEKGKDKLLLYERIFGKENLFIEIQDNELPEQYVLNEQLIRMSEETGIGLVATNDIHYVKSEDADYHDMLMAMQAKTTIYNDKRKKYGSNEFYLKSYDEMNRGRLPVSAIENTSKIADMCNFDFDFSSTHIPTFPQPAEYETSYDYLRYLSYKGMAERFEGVYEVDREFTEEHNERLEYELSVIKQMGYIDYFLIVWDFENYAGKIGALSGPGRGSAAGSLLSYCLYITDIDPIPHGYIFERFLNPSRVSMPDSIESSLLVIISVKVCERFSQAV